MYGKLVLYAISLNFIFYARYYNNSIVQIDKKNIYLCPDLIQKNGCIHVKLNDHFYFYDKRYCRQCWVRKKQTFLGQEKF